MKTTLESVADCIRETVSSGPVPIVRDTSAANVRGWDSLSHTMILLNLEERFGIIIPTERIITLESVGDLVDLIDELAALKG